MIHNGSHRAYALRAAGHTHAPCLIRTCLGATSLSSFHPRFSSGSACTSKNHAPRF